MKKLIYLLIPLFILISCNQSTKPEDVEQYKDPTGHYEFDIKTKFAQKSYITGAKNGLISYLKRCDWAEVVYTGEDYSVWLKNADRKQLDDSTWNLSFDLELRTPAMITEGDLMARQPENITYILNHDWIGQAGNPKAEEVQRLYNVYCQKMEMTKKLLPYVEKLAKSSQPQFAKLIGIIFDLIDEFMPEENSKFQKAEAVIIGAECYGQASDWMKQLETGTYYIYEHNQGEIQ